MKQNVAVVFCKKACGLVSAHVVVCVDAADKLVLPFDGRDRNGKIRQFPRRDGVASVKNFVGLENFGGVMRDSQFWTSLLLTFKYVVFVVVIVNVIAFAIAYLLTRGIKGQNFFRAGFFTPNLIGGIVLGYIWQFVFSRVFVSIGETTGWKLFEASWLSDPTNAFVALVVVSVWQLSGYMILIYVAGFMGLNEDVMEAASIDGATRSQTFFKIVLPLLKPIISTMVILNSMAFWNDFLLPSLVLTDKKLLTLPLSTSSFYGTYSADYGTIMAGLLLCVIPIMILYVALQKQIIGGVVAGAVR